MMKGKLGLEFDNRFRVLDFSLFLVSKYTSSFLLFVYKIINRSG